jgi:hypothetical protein
MVEAIRKKARDALESPNQTPFIISHIGGLGHTTKAPALNRNYDEYDRIMRKWLEETYNGSGIPALPGLGSILPSAIMQIPFLDTDILSGTGFVEKVFSGVAAITDGPYFTGWSNLSVFKELGEEVLDGGLDAITNPIYEVLKTGLEDYTYNLISEVVPPVVGDQIQKVISPGIDTVLDYAQTGTDIIEGLFK